MLDFEFGTFVGRVDLAPENGAVPTSENVVPGEACYFIAGRATAAAARTCGLFLFCKMTTYINSTGVVAANSHALRTNTVSVKLNQSLHDALQHTSI